VNLRKPILVHLSKQVGAPTTHSAAQAEYDAGGAGLVLGWDNSPSIIIVCNGYASAYSLIVTSRSSEGPTSKIRMGHRLKWLQTAANIFDLVYKGEGGITVSLARAERSPRYDERKRPPTEAA
jgi:hypothetical protein